MGGSVSGATSLTTSGAIFTNGHVTSITVGGSIIAGEDNSSGTLTESGSITIGQGLDSLTVGGSILGNSTGATVDITAGGPKVKGPNSDVAFGKITVGGRVELANFFAGYKGVSSPKDGDAQIGAVKVGGDWIASNLVAGALAGADKFFGNVDDSIIPACNGTTNDQAITAKFASIVIGGHVVGTSGALNGGDHFGFVSQQIGSFKSGSFTAGLTAAKDAPLELSLPRQPADWRSQTHPSTSVLPSNSSPDAARFSSSSPVVAARTASRRSSASRRRAKET